MDFLNTLLQIVIFVLCLSSLIVIHEAGHLAAAKIFNVYCADFSVGFGKAFLHKKRKNGETYFSLRVIPFGGYVAMAGEEGELEEGLDIPKERTINGIKKWKAGIIMSSGILMNLVTSILLFYIFNQCFITQQIYLNIFDVKEDSIAEKASVKGFNNETGEGDYLQYITDERTIPSGQYVWYYSMNSFATFEDGSTTPVVASVSQASTSLTDRSYDNKMKYYTYDEENLSKNKQILANYEIEVLPTSINKNKSPIVSMTLVLNTYQKGEENSYFCPSCGLDVEHDHLIEENGYFYHKDCAYPSLKNNKSLVMTNVKSGGQKHLVLNVVENEENKKVFQDTGLQMHLYEHWQSFGEAWTNTFKQFGKGSILIFETLGGLFVGKGWENVGSIVAIYSSQSSILSSMGPAYLVQYWALISVNLAIFNLLPFPGLDGWQLLVLTIEGITRKKIPDKVKVIVSYVGLALLFGLMLVLLVKDVIGLF